MKALISSSQIPLFHISNSSSPWKHKTPKTLQPKATSEPRATRRPDAKGFSGARAASKPIAAVEVAKSDRDKNKNKEDEEIPQVVFERMMARIVVSVGAPMAAGLASMKFFGAVRGQWDIPIWVQLVTLLCTFGVSTVGLAYGALSSSWDAENKGSLLGVQEFQKNWADMWREEDESNGNNN